MDAEFRSFLAQQMPLILEQLDREVNDSHGWWASGTAQLAAGRVLSCLWGQLTEWINRLRPRLEEEINQATRPAKALLESQLAAIPSAVVSVMGGILGDPVQKPDDAEPLPSLSLPPLAPRKPQWTPKMTRTLKYVPMLLGRRHLRECLRRQLGEVIAACRTEVSKAVERGVNQAVDQLASAVHVLASQVESRLMKALSAHVGGVPPPAEGAPANADPANGQQEIAELQESLSSLREAILRHDSAGLKALDQGPAVVVPSLPPRTEAEPGSTANKQRRVRSELQAWGCPVCNRLMEAVFDFYRKWQYNLSTDEPTQRAFADQLGFCPLHTWQLAALASPKGLSLGYPKLLERVSAALSDLLGGPSATAGAVAALIPRTESCQVCRLLQSEEQEHIARLSQSLAEPAGREAYSRSQGVCLRHLAALLAASLPADLARFLLGEAVRRFDHIAEDMRNYAIKRDALRAGLMTDEEEEAHLRALVHLAGHKGLCGFWSAEGSS
jgi:hypothetical protein